jgi:hypothetical protein
VANAAIAAHAIFYDENPSCVALNAVNFTTEHTKDHREHYAKEAFPDALCDLGVLCREF